jgi:hypothetical protein
VSLDFIEHIPDWHERIARQDAFWQREIVGRPVVCLSLPKPGRPNPAAAAWPHAALRDRWMDAQFVAECALAEATNREYFGDALPTAWPNLGPDLFAALLGCELEFAQDTSWSVPCLKSWADAAKVSFSEDGFYWKKLLEMTDALLEIGKGKFYTGLTDMHPGGDAIAALRGPEQLNLDLTEALGEVKALLARVNAIFSQIYGFYYEKLIGAGQAITNWCGIVSTRKWHVVSNDFSCMISPAMFDDVFLPGIIEECRQLEASIYHLDGPGALPHLDSLLRIEALDAIQWVPGAGHGRASDWLAVYKKCQAAGKGLQLTLEPDEVDLLMENLRPEGLWIWLDGVADREQADAIIKKLHKWR